MKNYNQQKNKTKNFNKLDFKKRVTEMVKYLSRRTIETATKQEIYDAVVITIRDYIMDDWINTDEVYESKNVKHLYYLSMEFLIGRSLSNNLINLSIKQEIKEVLQEYGIDYNEIEELERDPGLGNGGLGRLAACFMDSLATLKLPAYGCGIRYKYGIFEQKIENGYQKEYPDMWLEHGNPWEVKRPEHQHNVRFGGNVYLSPEKDGKMKVVHENYEEIKAVPYDIPVIGYGSNNINTLRLWDAEPVHEIDLRSFDEGNYEGAVHERTLAETIVEILYPNDNHYKGKELRLKQQYFFVSATLQEALRKFKENNKNLVDLKEKVVFQLNDTHPTVAIAELMRLLLDENNLSWEEAWDITTHTCAYTNHTILAEALEKWPVELFSRLLPRVYQIVEEINRRFCLDLITKYKKNDEEIRKVAIIADGQVKMAWLAIAGSFSVNGVAELHTNILKNQELKDFYEIYPEKFNNKTNGITQRRWLLKSNPELSNLITEKIGDEWITNLDELKKLEKFADEEQFQKSFMQVKYNNKLNLAKYIKEKYDIDINPNSIFDVQIKRLHEYKRQLLNVLHILYLYNKIKQNPLIDFYPRTFIFAAKAAPGYRRAKLIIKLINDMAKIINNDASINNRIKVVFLENYGVSLAEKIFPASDVSEQISTASKEASGTGNMKFMINGAITLGTLDGANIEIKEEVGCENIFIFGLAAQEVIKLNYTNEYDPWNIYYTNKELEEVLNKLVNGSISQDMNLYKELFDSLLGGYGNRGDEYYVLKDFESYVESQEKIDEAYRDAKKWARMSIINVAKSGKFSSDRTINEYVNDIWKIEPINIEHANEEFVS